jgi:hypothetical protein
VASTAVVVLTGCGLLVHYATPVPAVLAYLGYLLLAVLLPGTLVHKALRGPQDSWLADLTLGAITGLALELGAWAAFTGLGLPHLLWTWPVLTLALLGLPAARHRIMARPTSPWPPWPTVVVAASSLVVIAHVTFRYVRAYRLPPTTTAYYPDLLWHLGLVNEATRSFPLSTPQVIGEGDLKYHWFANAHIGASALISRVDTPTTFFRLWILPVSVLAVLGVAVLTHRLSGRPWAAALAALLTTGTGTFQFWTGATWSFDQFTGLSPSQTFSMPITLLAVYCLTDIVRSGRRVGKGTWALLLLALVATTGSKASAMPMLLGGVGMALLAALVMRRGRAVALVLCGLVGTLTVAALALVTGGYTGSGYQLLSVVGILPFYRNLVTARPNFDPVVLPGLVHTPAGPIVLLSSVLLLVLGFLRTAALVLPFINRTLRRDPAAWLLSGVCAAAALALVVIEHAGYSQLYFAFGSVPFGAALLGWTMAELVGDDRRRLRVALATGVASAVAAAALQWRAAHQPAPGGRAQWMSTAREFVVEIVVVGLGLAVVSVVAAVRSRRDHPSLVLPAVLALVLGPIAIGSIVGDPLSRVTRPADGQAATPPASAAAKAATAAGVARADRIRLAETEASVWIRTHVPTDDLTATNAHCLSGTGDACDGRRWWLSGLGGRRALVEGWGYTPSAAAGHHFVDTQLLALNQSAFEAPTEGVLARMRALGVRWLVVERLPGLSVSPALPGLADLRFDNAVVSVYRLR